MSKYQEFVDGVDAPLWPITVFVGLVVLVVLPLFGVGTFWLRIMIGIFMWIGLAQSWNIIGGYAGYLDFGHGAYFGIGAFVTGILMVHYSMSFLSGLLLAGLFVAIVSYVIGLPTLRLTGAYFAIATWALAEATRQLTLVLEITGGTAGMSLPTGLDAYGIPLPTVPRIWVIYYTMLVLGGGTVLITYILLERMEFGYRVKAVRDDDDAAESVGINTNRVKRQVYVLSCVPAGLLGGAYAYFITFIHPHEVLAALITAQMVVMVLVGGLGTVWGPVVGGAFLFLLNRMSAVYLGTDTVYIAMIGVLIMIVVLFAPNGIHGIVRGDISTQDVRQNYRSIRDKFNIY